MSESWKDVFEYELKRKLSLKTKRSTSDSILLFNTFKFYDVLNNGFVNRTQWQQAYAKLGWNGFTGADFNELFKIYDVDNKGCIDYKKFAWGWYGDASNANGKENNFTPVKSNFNNMKSNEINIPQREERSDPQQGSQQYAQQQQMNQVQRNQKEYFERNNYYGNNNNYNYNNKPQTPLRNEVKQYFKYWLSLVQAKINKYNGITYYSFYGKIKEWEDTFTHRISLDNVLAAFSFLKWELQDKNLIDLFSLLDLGDFGKVLSDELLSIIRGQMNERRKGAVIKAFMKLDVNKKGEVNVSEVKSQYNANVHPDIKIGWVKNPADVYEAFSYIWDIFCSGKGISHSGNISFDNFIEFYDGISASINNDDYFCDIINSVWNLYSSVGNLTQNDNSEGQGNVTANALNKLRYTVRSRGQNGIFALLHLAKIIDSSNTGILRSEDFFELCLKYKMDLTSQEIQSLCIEPQTGGINYRDLFKAIYGEMNDIRKNSVFNVFKRLSRNTESININELRNWYTCVNHPDVINKRRSQEELYGEFLDNLESFLFYIGKSKNETMLSFGEFMEYYNMVSMSIQDDQLFDIIITSSWN